MQNPSTDGIKLDDLRDIDALVAENPRVLSASMLRWQLRHRHNNGLSAACVRVGKRLFISKTRYEQWLATQAEAGRAAA